MPGIGPELWAKLKDYGEELSTEQEVGQPEMELKDFLTDHFTGLRLDAQDIRDFQGDRFKVETDLFSNYLEKYVSDVFKTYYTPWLVRPEPLGRNLFPDFGILHDTHEWKAFPPPSVGTKIAGNDLLHHLATKPWQESFSTFMELKTYNINPESKTKRKSTRPIMDLGLLIRMVAAGHGELFRNLHWLLLDFSVSGESLYFRKVTYGRLETIVGRNGDFPSVEVKTKNERKVVQLQHSTQTLYESQREVFESISDFLLNDNRGQALAKAVGAKCVDKFRQEIKLVDW